MTDPIANLLLALGMFAVGFVSIGPNILAIMGTSMARGRRHGIALAVGISIGSGLWAMLTVAGLTALVSAYAVTFSTEPVIAFYCRSRRWIDGALGVFFSLAALKLITFRPS